MSIEDELREAYRIGRENKQRKRYERALWFTIALLVVDTVAIVWGLLLRK